MIQVFGIRLTCKMILSRADASDDLFEFSHHLPTTKNKTKQNSHLISSEGE